MVEISNSINDFHDHELSNFLYPEKALEIIRYRPWIGYSKASFIMKNKLTKAFYHAMYDRTKRPLAYYIVGLINSGKSYILERWLQGLTQVTIPNEFPELDGKDFVFVYHETPSHVRSAKKLFRSILRDHFGMDIRNSILKAMDTDEILSILIDQLEEKQVKILIIDELQDLLDHPSAEQLRIFKVFKKMLNSRKISIGLILCGTMNALPLLNNKEWADERITGVELTRWVDRPINVKKLTKVTVDGNDEYVEETVKKNEFREDLQLIWQIYCKQKKWLPDWDLISFENGKPKWNTSQIKVIKKLSDMRFGKLVELIRHSAIHAIVNGRTKITKKDLTSVYNQDIWYDIDDEGKLVRKQYSSEYISDYKGSKKTKGSKNKSRGKNSRKK